MGYPESAHSLKLGVVLPEAEQVVRWSELRRMVLAAEAVGFDSVWVCDHLLIQNPGCEPIGPWELWSTLSAIAAVTETIELGSLVAATSFHAPPMLAKKASTVDEISDGRLILGLGAGWNQIEYRAFGYPYDHRVSRFEEAFTIIRRLLAGETVSWHGKYYQIEECTLLPRSARSDGGPPLLVGSIGPRMLGITLPFVDLWNVWYSDFGNSVTGLLPVLEKLDAACELAGRDPSTLGRTAAVLVRAPKNCGQPSVADDPVANPPITGTPAVVAERLAEFADAGLQHLQLVLDPITTESIQWCGDVIRALRTE